MAAAANAIACVIDGLPLRPTGISARLTSEASLTDGHGVAFLDYSPIIGLANPVALPLTLRFVGDHVEGTSTFAAAYEGPPGHVHGGSIAAAFDEVLGMVQTFSGTPGMTGRLSISDRSPTPLDTPLRWEGTMDRVDGRKIYTSGRVFNANTGTLLAEAEGLFISIDFARFALAMADTGSATLVPPSTNSSPTTESA